MPKEAQVKSPANAKASAAKSGKQPARKSRKRRFTVRFAIVACILLLYALGMVIYSQESKLKEIRAEQEALEEEYLALQNEQQRLERMIDYAKSDEYLIQYAREKLGYVLPDDIKFHIED